VLQIDLGLGLWFERLSETVMLQIYLGQGAGFKIAGKEREKTNQNEQMGGEAR
jgi:hypothetical protein